MKRRQLLISGFALLLILLFVVSCAPARRPGEVPPEGVPRQTRYFPRMTPRRPGPAPVPAPGPAPAPRQGMPTPRRAPGPEGTPRRTPGTGGDMTTRAEEIATMVAREDEIESATCVITGNTALVGVQFDDQYRGQLTDNIKQKIDRSVKQEDERINRVVVTADPDLVTRIETMFREVGRGRPITGFTREMQEMINRVQPR